MTDEPQVGVGAPLDDRTDASDSEDVDPRRLRSLIGLTLARLGPRARGAVSGTFLTLLVGEHTKSLFAITFALVVHRAITWVANPIAGRLSDKSETPIGRRVPYMAAGLLATGACTAFVTHANSYWSLVALLLGARLAFVVYYVPSAAVTPETFGSNRWVRALAIIGVGGLIVGTSIRVTVLATWNQNDPNTWAPAYYLAAAYIAFAALSIIFLVREAPSAQRLAKQAQHDHHPLDGIRSVFAAPNAKVLLLAVCLALASGGAFERVYPLWVRDVLGGGGKELAIQWFAEGPLLALSLPLAWVLASKVSVKDDGGGRRTFRRGQRSRTLLGNRALAIDRATSRLDFVPRGRGPVSRPLYLQILPRRGGLGEGLGLIVAPILVAGMIGGFTSAIFYDLLWQDYRAIWTTTAVFGFISGISYLWLKVPPGARRANPGRMVKTLVRVLWGSSRGRDLLRGELGAQDTDGTKLLDASPMSSTRISKSSC